MGATHVDKLLDQPGPEQPHLLPAALDERATLTQFLQYQRLTVHAKCLGLAHANAAKTPLPSSPAMSVTGLVSHLRWGEAYWVDVIFLGQPYQWPGTEQDPSYRCGQDWSGHWMSC